jgi:hypothetical protein
MEEISPIYEQVDIRGWADRIREEKIRELENLISENKSLLRAMDEYFYPEYHKDYVRTKFVRLKEKLNILKTNEADFI